MDAGIYKITNLVNQKVYIGQSVRLQQRLQQHRTQLESNRHFNKHLQRSYNKYGIENFKFEVIDYVDNISELDSLEGYYIELFNSSNSNKGFNKKTYIQGKTICTEETRKKLSDSHKGIIPSQITIDKRTKVLRKRKISTNTTGHHNIINNKNKGYSVEFKEGKYKYKLFYFNNLNFALLIRDLFFNYTHEQRQELHLILKQCLTKTGYFNIQKVDGSYVAIHTPNKKKITIARDKDIDNVALSFNEYVINNNLNLNLNLIPLNKGVFENNVWCCNLEV